MAVQGRLYPQPDSANPVLRPGETTQDGYLSPGAVASSDVIGAAQGSVVAAVAQAGGDVTGSGSISAEAGAIAATGLETFTGAATMLASAGSIAAIGLETFSATGDVTAPSGAIAATGLETFSGAGAVTAVAGAVEASGAVASGITGTGDLSAPAGAIDAIGTIPIAAVASGRGTRRKRRRVVARSVQTIQAITGEAIVQSPSGVIRARGDVVLLAVAGAGRADAFVGAMDGAGSVSAARPQAAAPVFAHRVRVAVAAEASPRVAPIAARAITGVATMAAPAPAVGGGVVLLFPARVAVEIVHVAVDGSASVASAPGRISATGDQDSDLLEVAIMVAWMRSREAA